MEFLADLDKDITLLFNHEWRNAFFDIVLPYFSEIWLLLVCLFLFLTLYYRHLKKNTYFNLKSFLSFPIFIITSVVINNLISDFIKYLADRPRPYQALSHIFFQSDGEWFNTGFLFFARDGGTSFLSSHSSNSMAIACAFYLYFGRKHPLIFLLPLIVSWSRLYLGKHYFFDVLAGCILGYLVTYIIYKILKKYFPIYYK